MSVGKYSKEFCFSTSFINLKDNSVCNELLNIFCSISFKLINSEFV